MDSWHDRLEYALQKRGKKWPDLVAATGLSKPSVYAWRPGATKRTEMMDGDNAATVCAYLGINALWLFSNKGPSGLEHENSGMQRVIPEVIGARRVPVISWAQAGEYPDGVEHWDADEWVEASVPVKRHTFALRVGDDRMAPEFPQGVVIVVEPELDANPNDYVIVRGTGAEHAEATFKQLVRDGDDFYLKPLNDRYPIKPLGTSTTVGVVREMAKKFR